MKEAIINIFCLALLATISWGTVCIVVKLIALCWGLTASLSISTGIWLSLILLKMTFNTDKNKK